MTSASHETITLGGYLAERLRQLGCDRAFGLPGDYNLALLDELLAAGLTWTGTANELGAAYAADGYARMRRSLGALVTTYGVGELSALNGIAGAFAEDVPVVHVVGMPATTAQGERTLLHHTLVDGDMSHFVRMQGEISAAVTVLRTPDAGAVDRLLVDAVASSKPVYLGIPSDLATAPVDRARLEQPLPLRTSDPSALEALRDALAHRLADEPRVVLLTGVRTHRRHGEALVAELARIDGVRVAAQLSSKSLLDESDPANLGTYAGALTADERTRAQVDGADALILVGTIMSDILTGFFSHGFREAETIELQPGLARIGGTRIYGVELRDALGLLHEVLLARRVDPASHAARPGDAVIAPPRELEAPDPDAPLSHAAVWPTLERWLRPDTLLVAEAGTAFYGAVDLRMPDRCDVLGQPVWSSIGYTLPATLGAMLAVPGRETVLVIGDGAAQLTVQELGTIFANGLTPTILVINNDGYTIERLIRSPEAAYQDITAWNWTALPAALGFPGVGVSRATTAAELEGALDAASAEPDRAHLIEVVVPRDDAPALLRAVAGSIR
ncbi:alpha-keto acid decarboxylase family protein [Homoserinibacter sp. YIM 151385]|uniref:alpha-keto acid decarboxylase family protein n=1 Tax=Homoserinibacter sp. YIM 151385 TaxID=2985506 RepID=UPI0022F12A5B|nr:thiamine pyrophosphate-binding protein [Homoserinibacter sp. YIM 151385]WBU37893.1 thiamine pyrophosphate-binding protein [Homoserinibacter sp. YIM 151385]